MSGPTVYLQPWIVNDIRECYFYHTMDVPGYGEVKGEWDLRGREAQYLGNVFLKGKRVLEVGTASGFLCFYMEKQGAQVVAYDLSQDQDWDMVPFSRIDEERARQMIRQRKEHVRRINNGYWLAHRANRSQARVVYGTAYEIPREIGDVDISIFGSVLLHLRDPFLALQSAAALTRETIVVSDRSSKRVRYFERVARKLGVRLPIMAFWPDYRTCEPHETWWRLSPSLVESFLCVLGFEETRVSYSTYQHKLGKVEGYTVVAHRTRLRRE
jgi:SAM-dependent methyltransferase